MVITDKESIFRGRSVITDWGHASGTVSAGVYAYLTCFLRDLLGLPVGQSRASVSVALMFSAFLRQSAMQAWLALGAKNIQAKESCLQSTAVQN
uniref:DNA-directed RNA polymerase n=1 Tax=Panagrellus redivivus TaxID=6233 RepID=A0A7E4V740_PANRE